MTRNEIEALLAKALVGRLGTCNRDEPYVVPICFLHVENKIYFHSRSEGKKLENIKVNPRVCFQVDEYNLVPSPRPCDFSMHYRSVIIFGRVRFLKDAKERLKALKAMLDKYDTSHSAEPIDEAMVDRVAVAEITVEEMSGKKNI
jgi:nitroimidazol reductase NimA-like FMN-containing flavoprotein (pyridoxamine 5'-phosphate oxidase superfamily)